MARVRFRTLMSIVERFRADNDPAVRADTLLIEVPLFQALPHQLGHPGKS
jgi:hypothetical protein